jgi:hypothetical protein
VRIASVALAIGAVIVPSASAADSPACQPPAAASYRDTDIVVWTQDAANAHVLFVGCRRATGRTFTVLDFDNACISASGACDDVYPKIRRVRRSGRWLAMDVESQIYGTIALADVRGGTTRRQRGYLSASPPREMILGRDGTLAWIADYEPRDSTTTSRQLRLCDASCRAAGTNAPTIARGAKLAHLQIVGHRVIWRDGKRRRSRTVS